MALRLGSLTGARYNIAMTDRICIIWHEVIPSCGSFEVVRFADGRESEFFYWDDIPGPVAAAGDADARAGAQTGQGVGAGGGG